MYSISRMIVICLMKSKLVIKDFKTKIVPLETNSTI